MRAEKLFLVLPSRDLMAQLPGFSVATAMWLDQCAGGGCFCSCAHSLLQQSFIYDVHVFKDTALCFISARTLYLGDTANCRSSLQIAVSKTSFKANSKALAEKEADGMAKMIYRKDTGEILGVHIFGLHAADLIHEASNAIALGQTVQDIKFTVHAHPTLSETMQEMIQGAHVDAKASAKEAVTA